MLPKMLIVFDQCVASCDRSECLSSEFLGNISDITFRRLSINSKSFLIRAYCTLYCRFVTVRMQQVEVLVAVMQVRSVSMHRRSTARHRRPLQSLQPASSTSFSRRWSNHIAVAPNSLSSHSSQGLPYSTLYQSASSIPSHASLAILPRPIIGSTTSDSHPCK